MPDRSADMPAQPTKKKPYSPPVLQAWGNLRDLTQAVGAAGADDGGKGKQPRRTR